MSAVVHGSILFFVGGIVWVHEHIPATAFVNPGAGPVADLDILPPPEPQGLDSIDLPSVEIDSLVSPSSDETAVEVPPGLSIGPLLASSGHGLLPPTPSTPQVLGRALASVGAAARGGGLSAFGTMRQESSALVGRLYDLKQWASTGVAPPGSTGPPGSTLDI